MKISVGLYGTNAHQIALAMIQGFNKHYTLFRQTSREAKTRFEQGDWLGVHKAVKERIRFYDDRVDECVERLRCEFDAGTIDDATWQQVKLLYIGLLLNHKQPELAETFFNSVTTKILHRNYSTTTSSSSAPPFRPRTSKATTHRRTGAITPRMRGCAARSATSSGISTGTDRLRIWTGISSMYTKPSIAT